MSGAPPRHPGPRRIVVADQDPTAVELIITTLRTDGYAVFQAYDVRSAVELASFLGSCDLVISNTRVAGADGVDLIVQLRRERPDLPILYLATDAFSSPELERELPPDVPVLREPFTAETIRASVRALFGPRAEGGTGGAASPS